MRDGQKAILKELIIQPYFETICDAYSYPQSHEDSECSVII